jgi:hypothetical protein
LADFTRFVFAAVILLAVVLTAVLMQSEWSGDLAPKLTTNSRVADEAEKCRQRLKKKQQIVKLLLEGRVTFFEAAACFQRVNKESSAIGDANNPGAETEEECACRQLLNWVRSETWMMPNHRDILSQMEDELKQHKARHGAVVLPDVPADNHLPEIVDAE